MDDGYLYTQFLPASRMSDEEDGTTVSTSKKAWWGKCTCGIKAPDDPLYQGLIVNRH